MRIVTKLHGLDGKLSKSNAELLRSLLKNSEHSLWLRAKNMIICNRPIITLEKAVKCVLSDNINLQETPDPFTLYRAIRFSLERQRAFKYNMDVCDTES